MSNSSSKIFLGVILGVIVFAGWAVWREFSRELPGQAVSEIGADHVTDISSIEYNFSNPPTSGPHFAVWAKPGVYDRVISDGYLIHSLEHGYIVISYNCAKPISISPFSIFNVYAHETGELHDEPIATGSGEATDSAKPLTQLKFSPPQGMSWFTPENPPEKEVELSENFNSSQCRDLVNNLFEMTKIADRVIVTPRPQNDSLIALTAWGRIDKLERFDKGRIENFIKAWHNKGPEKTAE